MKIAMLTTDGRELLKAYDAPLPSFGTAPAALLQGFRQLPGLEVHVISCVRRPMPLPAKLAPNVFLHSLIVPKIGWMTTAYQGCIRAVRKKLREIRPDVVHGQGTERECAMAAVFSGYPNVLTIHGNMAHLARVLKAPVRSYAWLAARLEDFALRRTAGVLCNSAHTETLVRSRTRRTWRVPNAVREEFFAQPIPQRPRGKCRLLNIGVISRGKRQLELLEALRKESDQGSDFQLRFIGLASADPYATQFLEQVQKTTFAEYAGPKHIHELIAEIDSAHGMVHFPVEESFGLVVAEGLARNLKFFGARTGGIPDVIGNIQSATLVPSDDFDGLARAISDWIRKGSPPCSDGADSIYARFSPVSIAKRHLEIYQEILRG